MARKRKQKMFLVFTNEYDGYGLVLTDGGDPTYITGEFYYSGIGTHDDTEDTGVVLCNETTDRVLGKTLKRLEFFELEVKIKRKGKIVILDHQTREELTTKEIKEKIL